MVEPSGDAIASAAAVQGATPPAAVVEVVPGAAVVLEVGALQTTSFLLTAVASADSVSGPSSPSVSRHIAAWKARIAASLRGPRMPSTAPV